MSKKHVALAVGGALVVASAAYLFFRTRPAKQIPKPCRAATPAPVPVSVPVPEQESVEELEVKTLSGDTKAMCKLALLHLKEDASGHDVARALELLRNAAEKGSSDAMKHLGSCYLSAHLPDVPLDPEQAVRWWQRAVDAGCGAAAKMLGDLYLNRKILRLADADSGFAPNQMVALHGLSNAQLNGALGVVTDAAAQSPVLPERLEVRLVLASQEIMQKHAKYFSEGLKVKVANLTRLTNVKDFGRAASYYRKGIELACSDSSAPECMVELAKLYEEGQGLQKNEAEAFKLFQMAADAGFPPAFPRLAMCYYTGAGVQQDDSRCLELVSCTSDLSESQLVLSFLYSEGRGVEKDEAKALQLLRDAAQSSDIAMHILGNMHLSGQNVEQDAAAAFRYLKQASDLDFAPAQAICGQMLVEGMGCDRTEENMHLGFKLLSLAAEQNEPHALLTLRQAHLMQGDAAGALEMLKRAVSVKHPEAMYIYGHMLKDGQGVAVDAAEGERLMAEAVALGFDVAAATAANQGP